MNRRIPFSVLLLFLMTGCTMWKESKTKTWSNATSGEQLERLFWNDLKDKKWTEVERHLASGFVYLSPRGATLDKATALEELKRTDIADFSLGDFVTQANGPDMVVTYTVALHGTHDGQPLPSGPIHMMTVWQQIPHGWIAIAHSRVPQTNPSPPSATAK